VLDLRSDLLSLPTCLHFLRHYFKVFEEYLKSFGKPLRKFHIFFLVVLF